MKRIAIGAVTALSVWFGSALAAEAQTITPNGPTTIYAGTNSWNYTASVYLPTPMTFRVTTSIYKNNVYQCQYIQTVPNPGISNYNFSQCCVVSFSVASGDVVTFKSSMLWNKITTNGPDWNVTVSPTRPSTTVTKGSLPASKRPASAPLALASDRRRE